MSGPGEVTAVGEPHLAQSHGIGAADVEHSTNLQASTLGESRVRRRRLDHVDAMRPLKQVGVVSTHCLIVFAPGSLLVGAALQLLHVSREGFLFVSACMLTYAYYSISLRDLGTFWRRRLLAVGLPYVCWTFIYFFIALPGYKGSALDATGKLGLLIVTGYSQLYFLVVLLQFYVLFPAVVWLLKKTERHHVAVFWLSLFIQALYVSLMHWNVLPGFLRGYSATREVFSYQFYLLAGCLAAVHYQRFHAWLVGHVKTIIALSFVTAALAEAWFWLASEHIVHFFGSASDPFQPIVIPFNMAGIAVIYIVGVGLVRPGTPVAVRRFTHVTSDNSYAIYLSQVAFLDILTALGWKHLNHVMPWPLTVAGGVIIVFLSGCLIGGLVGRTPIAWPFVGRHQVSWSSLKPWFLESRRKEEERSSLGPDGLALSSEGVTPQ